MGPTDERNWHARKEAYLQHLEGPELGPGVWRVSAADKLHNARSILSDLREHGPSICERFHAPAAEQRWYYSEVARILRERHDSVLTRELGRVVDNLTAEIDRSR